MLANLRAIEVVIVESEKGHTINLALQPKYLKVLRKSSILTLFPYKILLKHSQFVAIL